MSVASLAWTVHADLKNKTPQPSRDVVARAVRVKVQDHRPLDPGQFEVVVEVVVDETVNAGEPD